MCIVPILLTYLNVFAKLTKFGFEIYMVHYFLVGPSVMVVDFLKIPIPIQIPVAASITFAGAWLFTALVYKLLPEKAKWITG